MNDRTIEMTTDIVASYVTGNKLNPEDLPALIRSVFTSLSNVEAPVDAAPTQEKMTAAQIKKSIRADGLVSFEDGKTYQTLKRHLSKRGMTLAEYKDKWGLPNDYPTTAPSYSARRSEMAKSLGLGSMTRRTTTGAKPGPKAKAKK